MSGHSNYFVRGTIAVSLLIASVFVSFSSQAASCGKVTNSSTYWYACDGVRVTQSINTTLSNNSVSDFRVVDDRVVWKYTRRSGSGTTARSESAYYTNLTTGGSITQFTQLANSSFSEDEAVQELQVVGNRAVWRFFDGERNCNTTCRSNYAYYYVCLSDANIYTITDIARQSFSENESIVNFSMNFATDRSSWTYFDGRNSYSRQKTLASCNPQIQLDKPYAPRVSVSGRTVTLNWTAVPNAESYKRQVSVNGGPWKNTYVLTGTSKTYYNYAYGTYKYRLSACIGDNCSSWSNASNTITVSESGLSAPSSVSASVSNRTVTLNWSSVANADWYEREVSVNGGAWKNNYVLNGTSKTYFSYAYGTYRYRLRACNNSACSSSWTYSNTITVK
ncbi:hypothetical protein [Planctobacterium marinum]|uniref:Fibronectin type-III domain-containing protein n=1 Tax=Planctobacterium marinum TaxID=1631968 RepID=A0AA48KSB5_9ALTE|nr:hypothetical protein MACH26_24830 [Planctobacterium marinum]